MGRANGGQGSIDPAWRRAVHAYPLPMIIIDLAGHEAVDANDAALDLFAVRDGRPIDLADHIKLDDRHRQLAELVRSGTVDSFEAGITIRRAGAGMAPMDMRVW